MTRKTIKEILQDRVRNLHGYMTQAEIAERAGVSVSWLAKLLADDNLPSARKSQQMDQVQKLIFALDDIERERHRMPECDQCGTNEYVKLLGADALGSEFRCLKCGCGWAQET